jgi:UDP-3-O-[3-hydroxymyristoyl] glucosamine N-acyltransferase
MEFTAQQIAELLNGKVDGDQNAKVNTLSKIEEGKANSLSFLANPQYTPYIYSTKASIVIVNKDFEAEQAISSTLIRVDDAYQSFGKLLELYNQIKNNFKGIDPSAHIDESAQIGNDCYIGAAAFIGKNAKIGQHVQIHPQAFIGENVQIADNCIIHPGVRIYADCVIGSDCIIHAGSIIGADGFGFAPNSTNNYKKVPQIGNVIIEEHVEIGANTCIDRATLGSTIIRKGVKLDNLIQVAHNVEIGENTVIAAQTGIAGSTKIGANCMIGGQVGIAGHLQIADGVKVAAQTGITNSINKAGITVQGTPAFEIGAHRRSSVIFKKLPELYRQIEEFKKEISSLRNE